MMSTEYFPQCFQRKRGMIQRPVAVSNDRTREAIEDEECEKLQQRFGSDEFHCPICGQQAKLKAGFLLGTTRSGNSPRFLYSNEECCEHSREKAEAAFEETAKAIEARSPKTNVVPSVPKTGGPSTARAITKKGFGGLKRH